MSLNEALEEVPQLSQQQLQRLDRAIELHEIAARNGGEYETFKAGTLHAYRILINLKVIVKHYAELDIDGFHDNYREVARSIEKNAKALFVDIVSVVHYYVNSFEEVKTLVASVDRTLKRFSVNSDLREVVMQAQKDELAFLNYLFTINKEFTSKIAQNFLAIILDEERKQRIEAGLPTFNEVNEASIKVEHMIRIFVNNWLNTNDENNANTRKSIINETVDIIISQVKKDDIKLQVRDAIRTGVYSNLVDQLIEDNKDHFETLINYAKALHGEIKISELPEKVRKEVKLLEKAVHLDMLKSEYEDLLATLNDELKLTKFAADAMQEANLEKLREREAGLKEVIAELENKLEQDINDIKAKLEDVNSKD